MINSKIQNQLNKILKTIKEEHIQKIVVGAVIFLKPKSVLLLKRKSNDFMGGLIVFLGSIIPAASPNAK